MHFAVQFLNSQVILASHEDRYEAQRQAIVVINTLNELDESWIGSQTDIINALKSIWNADLHKVCDHRGSLN